MPPSVTITITPRQAQMLMSALQSGEAVVNIKESVKRGQKGGFLPLLAGLAAPVVGSLLAGAVDKMMGKGHCGMCKGPTVTVTPRQFQTLAQTGAGIPVTVNFKVSKSKKHSMIGAGVMDFLPKLVMSTLPALFKSAVSSNIGQKAIGGITDAAKKVAASEAGKLGKRAVDGGKSLINRFTKKKESAPVPTAVPTPQTATATKTVIDRSGNGIRLAGNGTRLAGKGVNLAGRPSKKKVPPTGWKIQHY